MPPKKETESLVTKAMALALLYLCQKGSGRDSVGDRLKVAKLLFLATYKLYERHAAGLNLSFHKYTHGPFTEELYGIWEDLGWAGFLKIPPERSGQIAVTDEGARIAEFFLAEVLSLDQNAFFLNTLKEVASFGCVKSASQLLREVYEMRVKPLRRSEVTVAEIPAGAHITGKIERPKEVPTIPDSWLQWFDIQRRIGQAADPDEFLALLRLHSYEVLKALEEAIQADERGEGRRLGRKELHRELGIAGNDA